MRSRALLLSLVCVLALCAVAVAKTSHADWPTDLQLHKQSGPSGVVFNGSAGDDELLGHHGSDTLNGGDGNDVLWGDWDPSGQPTAQTDHIDGGPGNDFIYSSHGHNFIDAGPGDDYVKMHFGYGPIDCGPGDDTLEWSRTAQKRSPKPKNCEHITHRTLGY